MTEETATQESILKRITSALEIECGLTRCEIRDLADLVDPDACPSSFLAYLADTVSAELLPDWSDDKRRMVLKATVLIWMVKGMDRGWRALLNLRGMVSHIPWELWKRRIYEYYDYSPVPTYYGLKAARVDFVPPGDITDYAEPGLAQTFIDAVESIRPIHVLLRRFPIGEVEHEDQLAGATDAMGLATDQGYDDAPPDMTDSMTVTSTCLTWCESSCQITAESICGLSCETGCEELCEGACQTYSQTGCGLTCQLTCQSSCQAQCETVCETGSG